MSFSVLIVIFIHIHMKNYLKYFPIVKCLNVDLKISFMNVEEFWTNLECVIRSDGGGKATASCNIWKEHNRKEHIRKEHANKRGTLLTKNCWNYFCNVWSLCIHKKKIKSEGLNLLLLFNLFNKFLNNVWRVVRKFDNQFMNL